MEGGFDKECDEFGGCVPQLDMESKLQVKSKTRWNTVLEQWEEVKGYLVTNTKELEREEMKKACLNIWSELKLKEKVPCNDERRSLLPYLAKAADEAKFELEQYVKTKPSTLGKGRWKKQKKSLDDRRKYLHDMFVTCAALQFTQRKTETRTGKAEVTQNITPTAPTPQPPPYEYKPFAYADMNCILAKLPSPSEGGGPWMVRLMKATMGHKLALGDWRALMCEKTSPWEMEQVEMQAGTRQIPDSLPFTHYATAIGTAMRKRFPVPPGAMHTLTFTYKDGQDITEFLSKSKDTWTDVAGEHPSAGELHTTLFRKAILSALPKSVRGVMESNPDLPGANTEHWERHLKYHLKKNI